ncbi:MAG TPA: response regulator [Acidimicrobiales bacterium]|nr:response regulator [Acidimicrobiales bacterium]
MENVSGLPTRVVVIDDDIVVSEIMALSISKEKGLSLVGVAHTDRDAVKVVRREHPDVVLFNYRKADNGYVGTVRDVLAKSPRSRVVLVSGERNFGLGNDALRSGCSGVVGKDSSIAEILSAIRRAARGELVVSSRSVSARSAAALIT